MLCYNGGCADAPARRLRKRYRRHREHLFVFLHCPGVPPDNNACERALRPSVIHRKVTNGFRSEWGAHAYAALATVIETAKLHDRKSSTPWSASWDRRSSRL